MDKLRRHMAGLATLPIIGLTLAVVAGYAAVAYHSATATRITRLAPSFGGVASAQADATGRNVQLLVIHGIGTHCIGYSDDLIAGVLDTLGVTPGEPLDARLQRRWGDTLLDADAQVQEHGGRTEIPHRGQRVRETLDEALARLGGGAKDAAVLGPEAIELGAILKYGVAGTDCSPVATPTARDLGPASPRTARIYNDIDNRRINTCRFINAEHGDRQGDGGPRAHCQRLTLDFYHHEAVEEYVRTRTMPGGDASLPRCRSLEQGDGRECVRTEDYDLGFLTTTVYTPDPGASTDVERITVYELTWDPATRWAKNTYTADDNSVTREKLNEVLKRNVVNDSLADAVMYLGSYRSLIQYPLLATFCKMLSDLDPHAPVHAALPDTFRCSGTSSWKPEDVREFADGNELVVITHSLGTRILFDTLGLIGRDDFHEELARTFPLNFVHMTEDESRAIGERVEHLRDPFIASLGKIFVLANQVPLLELSSLSRPYRLPVIGDRDLGRGFERLVKRREELRGGASPLQIVAFSDPNDLLSYDLRCWYQKHVLRWSDEVVDLAERVKNTGQAFDEIFWDALADCPRPEPGFLASAADRLLALVDPDASADARDTQPDPREQVLAGVWDTVGRRISFTEVALHLPGGNVPGLFSDPSGAHSNYFHNPDVHRLIGCGGVEETRAAAPCRVTIERSGP